MKTYSIAMPSHWLGKKLIPFISIFILVIAFVLFFYPMNFLSSLFQRSKLPIIPPSKTSIEYIQTGGMLNQGNRIYISPDSSYFSFHYQDAKNKIYFETNEEEFRKLYQVFLENKFDRIKEEKVMLYDAGGSHVALRFEDKFISKASGETSSILEKWSKNYWNIVDSINAFINKKVEPFKNEIIFIFDSSILNSNKETYISIANTNFRYYSKDDGAKSELKINLLSGEYYMDVSLLNNDGVNRYASLYSKIKIEKSTKQILFSLKEKEIEYKIVN